MRFIPTTYVRPRQGRVQLSSEAGFSILELVVVMIIMAIILGMGALGLKSFSTESPDPSYSESAARIWRGIQTYRLINGNQMPRASMTSPWDLKSRLVQDGGEPIVRTWPTDPLTNAELVVDAALSDTLGTNEPPLYNPSITTPKSRVVFRYASNQLAGWLAAYDSNGRLMWNRGFLDVTAPVDPPKFLAPMG